MVGREIVAQYRLSHWIQIMQERQESGLSIISYCNQTGIKPNSYYYWQRKIREVGCEQIAINTADPAYTSRSPVRFSEVRLVEDKHQSSVDHHGKINIEVAGISITADNGYIVDNLVTLLKGLVVK